MVEVTSPAVGKDAARLLKRRTLFEANGRKIVTAYRRLGKNLTLDNLERLGALLFPAK